MNTTTKLFGIFSLAALGAILPCATIYAATLAGQVQFTTGTVQVVPAEGNAHLLKKGDPIYEGDTVNTIVSSSAQIKMKDGGFIAVRHDTKMRFDKFVFKGTQNGEEKSFFSLFKGGFRAVTGLIGSVNKQNYKIVTPAATIGVRGTDHETYFVPISTAQVQAGAYSKVNVGETTLTTNQGTISVLPNQMGFSSGMNEVPKLAPINTNVFTVAATPTKTIKENKDEKSSKQEQKSDGQVAKDDSSGKTGNKDAKADKSVDKQDAALAVAGTGGSGKAVAAGAGDTTAIRTDVADAVPLAGPVTTSTTASAPTPVATPQIVAIQQTMPITLVDTSGNTLNASSQTILTSAGSTATVASIATLIAGGNTLSGAVGQATGLYAAYLGNNVELQDVSSSNWGWGSLAAPADLVYVAGGGASSGALLSYTERNVGGGAGWTYSSSITGGTATSANAPSFANTGIQIGAWTGYTSQTITNSYQLGGTNNGGSTSDWMYGPQGYLDSPNILSTAVNSTLGTGVFTYTYDGATAPRNTNSGLSGSLNTSATFAVNFATGTVSGSATLTMPGNEFWGVSLTNQVITLSANGLGNFYAAPGATGATVSHGIGSAAACATCSGNFAVAFTGQNYVGAIISYVLSDSAALATGNVSGSIALTRTTTTSNPPITNATITTPTGSIVVAENGGYIGTYSASTTTGNVLTAFSNPGSGGTVVACPTCTSTPATSSAATGIYYGNWVAGSYTSINTLASTNVNGVTGASVTPSYWITGPEAGPLFLAQALVGTASYTFDAGKVSNSNGVAGTVLGTTALTLNFTNQTVGINLDVSIADTLGTLHSWNATTSAGNEARLTSNQGIGGATFHAYTNGALGGGNGAGLLTISVDRGATPVTISSGMVDGQLTGSGLTGAIISFNLSGTLGATATTFENITGVAAFVGAAQNIATSHQYVSISTYDLATITPTLGFYASNSTRVFQDAAGNLTQFDSQAVASGSGANVTLTNVSATPMEHGTDPISGISWGRWAGGTVNVTDRLSGIVTPRVQAGSLHWISEPVATSAVSLPVSGTYNYIYVGGTNPTDNSGITGTLNSASVTANFNTQTVNVGVNATVAGATLNATATNAPIIQKTVFYASSREPAASTSYLNVTCTGTCGATGGTVVGKFTGVGAIGVAMSYGLQNGTSVVSGVAAFHR